MKKILANNLEIFICDVFKAVGLGSEQATIAAKHMIFADSQGTDTHGILRLPIYIKRIEMGLYNKDPSLVWEKETENSAILNADNGIGHYVTHLAMEKAIEKAKQKTIGFVNLYNGNHFGAAASYAKMAADNNMIGFITTNAGPTMAPTGGAERVLGNNPFAFAIPRENNYPIILDISCSNVAGGKIILANKKGEKIPLGWALDKEGRPTTDAYEGFEGGGVLLPVGEHKGYGLALIMDILAGVLSGGKYGKNVNMVYDTGKLAGVSCAMLAINIENFIPRELFNERVEDLVNMIKMSKKAVNVEKIYLPGEIENETREQRKETGIPIPDRLFGELNEISVKLDINITEYGFEEVKA